MARALIRLLSLFSKNSALRRAAHTGDEIAVRRLLVAGADINSGAVHLAALRADPQMVRLLASLGADINRVDSRGDAPLHLAAAEAHCDTVQALLEIGADVNARNANGCTALHIAAMANRQTVREMLPRMGSASLMEELPQERRRPDRRYVLLARNLLGSGAKLDPVTKCGITPLHIASRWAITELITLFIERGADVNAKNERGEFSLLWLALLGETDLAQLLVERGADVQAATKKGVTALHGAAARGHAQIAGMLAERGADVHAVAVSAMGMVSPVAVAKAAGNHQLAAFLESRSDASKIGAAVRHPD